jgi:hypothetical protein
MNWKWFSVEPIPDGHYELVEIDKNYKVIRTISRHKTKIQAKRRRNQLQRAQFFSHFHSV